MNPLAWIVLIALAVLYYVGSAIVKELALIVDRLGVLAEATWRVRDELTKLNKRNEP